MCKYLPHSIFIKSLSVMFFQGEMLSVLQAIFCHPVGSCVQLPAIWNPEIKGLSRLSVWAQILAGSAFLSSLAFQVCLVDYDVVTKGMTVAAVPILWFWDTCSLLRACSASALRNFWWVHLIFRLSIFWFFQFINLNSNFIFFDTKLQSYAGWNTLLINPIK